MQSRHATPALCFKVSSQPCDLKTCNARHHEDLTHCHHERFAEAGGAGAVGGGPEGAETKALHPGPAPSFKPGGAMRVTVPITTGPLGMGGALGMLSSFMSASYDSKRSALVLVPSALFLPR